MRKRQTILPHASQIRLWKVCEIDTALKNEWLSLCRHPSARHRPDFRNILLQLLGDESHLLHIPVRDASTSQQASQLGSILQAGRYMYSDLQRAYRSRRTSFKNEENYDSFIGRKYVFSFPTSSADIECLYTGHSSSQTSFKNQLNEADSDYENLKSRSHTQW